LRKLHFELVDLVLLGEALAREFPFDVVSLDLNLG